MENSSMINNEDFLNKYLSSQPDIFSPTGHSVNSVTPKLSFNSSDALSDRGTSVDDSYDISITSDAILLRDSATVNQELEVLGLRPIITTTGKLSVKRLVSASSIVIQKYSASLKERDDLQLSQKRWESELGIAGRKLSSLREQLELSRRAETQAKLNATEARKALKRETNNHKVSKEEVNKKQTLMTQRDKQFTHELRKKEQELNKLKEKLHSVLQIKQDKKFGMELSINLLRADGKRPTWGSNNKHEQEMYSVLIRRYEEQQQRLLAENSDLRQCIHRTQRELAQLILGTSLKHDDTFDTESVSVCDTTLTQPLHAVNERHQLTDGHYELPFDQTREVIERSLRSKVRQLRTKLELNADQEEEKEDTLESNQEAEDLKLQVSRYRDIINQQENIIETLSARTSSNTSVGDGDVVQLEAERRELKEQRRALTQTALQLSEERKQLEELRSQHLRQQLEFGVMSKASDREDLPRQEPPPKALEQITSSTFDLSLHEQMVDVLSNKSDHVTAPRSGYSEDKTKKNHSVTQRRRPSTPSKRPSTPQRRPSTPQTSARGQTRPSSRAEIQLEEEQMLKERRPSRRLPAAPLFSPAPTDSCADLPPVEAAPSSTNEPTGQASFHEAAGSTTESTKFDTLTDVALGPCIKHRTSATASKAIASPLQSVLPQPFSLSTETDNLSSSQQNDAHPNSDIADLLTRETGEREDKGTEQDVMNEALPVEEKSPGSNRTFTVSSSSISSLSIPELPEFSYEQTLTETIQSEDVTAAGDAGFGPSVQSSAADLEVTDKSIEPLTLSTALATLDPTGSPFRDGTTDVNPTSALSPGVGSSTVSGGSGRSKVEEELETLRLALLKRKHWLGSDNT